MLNNTKLRHFWAQIVSWAPRHARKTFIVLALGGDNAYMLPSQIRRCWSMWGALWEYPWCVSLDNQLSRHILAVFEGDHQAAALHGLRISHELSGEVCARILRMLARVRTFVFGHNVFDLDLQDRVHPLLCGSGWGVCDLGCTLSHRTLAHRTLAHRTLAHRTLAHLIDWKAFIQLSFNVHHPDIISWNAGKS